MIKATGMPMTDGMSTPITCVFSVPMVISTGMPMTNGMGMPMIWFFVPMVMATGMLMANATVELKKAKMGLTLMAIVFWLPFGM